MAFAEMGMEEIFARGTRMGSYPSMGNSPLTSRFLLTASPRTLDKIISFAECLRDPTLGKGVGGDLTEFGRAVKPQTARAPPLPAVPTPPPANAGPPPRRAARRPPLPVRRARGRPRAHQPPRAAALPRAALALDAGSRLGAPPPCLATSPLLEHAVALAAGRRSCCPAPARIAAKQPPRCSVPTHHGGGVSEEKVADIRLGGDPGAPSPGLICATATGCRLFKLIFEEFTVRIIPRDAPPLESVGPQKCLAFSTDGAKFAIGGEDGHLRIFHWPSMNVLLDEPKAHKSFRDMDISLDSEFLVSTSTDGSARIWKIDEGAPLVNLTRSSDEKIECCRFSRDGMKPFLFCTVAKGSKVVTVVWNVSDWKRIWYKRLLGKPTTTTTTTATKPLSPKQVGRFRGSNDGDFCAVDVKKMEVSHWSKKVHLGSSVTSIEFCPTERGSNNPPHASSNDGAGPSPQSPWPR
ncbi:SEC12-like protein 1 [Miscanthus floridulus]|uniref:SEC12-like protein 1 n=1 Tax=Miscanthus floridulus TaxID=154761 RepID=UPI003457F7C1